MVSFIPQHQYLCHIYVPYITKIKDLKPYYTTIILFIIIPPLQRWVMFLVELVSLSVCGHCSNCYERIMIRLCGWFLGGTRKN